MKHLLNNPTLFGLPKRAVKNQKTHSRHTGITHVIDDGVSLNVLANVFDLYGEYIDLLEFSGGTPFVMDSKVLIEKINLCKQYHIKPLLSGLVFEKFVVANEVDQYAQICSELGIEHFIVSNCYANISQQDKEKYIAQLSTAGAVYSQVGKADAAHIMPPYKWIEQMKQEREAGALYAIAYGAIGNLGIYRGSGEVREGLVQEIASHVNPETIIWDAIQPSQQHYFIEMFGVDVNLSQVYIKDIASMETMRLGLHRKTFSLYEESK